MQDMRMCEEGRGDTRKGGDDGFALVIVLVALLMLSVLGAASLLLMVSSLQGAANMKPEDRAFQVAEAGVYVAHAKIVNNEVKSSLTAPGSILGGDYRVTVSPKQGSSTEYVIVSEGKYEQGGRTYRRKIQEEVYYSGDQAYDAMRNYLLFAGRDLRITASELINLNVPITINGNIRAQRHVSIINRPLFSLGDGLTINGNVEGKESVYIETAPGFLGTLRTRVYGHIKTGDATNPASQGVVSLRTRGWLLATAQLFAASTGGTNWDIYRTSLTQQRDGPWDSIILGRQLAQRGVEKIYVPEPNFDYYKAIAIDQGNFTQGNRTLSGNLGSHGTSPITVIYCTGNMTLNGFAWNQPNMKGILVCEGNFVANNTLQFAGSSKFQVIAGGNISFNNRWNFSGTTANNEFFFWAGNDAYIDMGMFSDQRLQVTALRDIILDSRFELWSTCRVNYKTPDIDIAGFPIDLTVTNWKELPSE